MRNICLLNDSFPPQIDGVANAVINYANVITKCGSKAAVVTPYYPDVDDSVFPYPVYRYPSIDTTKLVGYRGGVPFSMDIMKKLENEHFDLIHSHCPVSSMLFSRHLQNYIDKPIVFTYHTKFDIDIANAMKSRVLQDAAKKMLVQNISEADEVWTVSKGAGENLHSLGYEGDYIVMPNGVDMPLGRVAENEIAAATEQYRIPPQIPVYLFVGRMMWYKGIRITLDALRALKTAGYDFRMFFIGGGTDFEEIKDYSESLNLGDKVIFTGPIRDREVLRAWYSRADLFLFPSTFDTNGLVVREASAAGLASVLISGSCAAEDVTDQRNGFLIDENAASMATMLAKLQEHPDMMKITGDHAENDLYISWEDAVKHAMERYEIVIENYKSHARRPRAQIEAELYRPLAEFSDEYLKIHKRIDTVAESVRTQFMEEFELEDKK